MRRKSVAHRLIVRSKCRLGIFPERARKTAVVVMQQKDFVRPIRADSTDHTMFAVAGTRKSALYGLYIVANTSQLLRKCFGVFMGPLSWPCWIPLRVQNSRTLSFRSILATRATAVRAEHNPSQLLRTTIQLACASTPYDVVLHVFRHARCAGKLRQWRL